MLVCSVGLSIRYTGCNLGMGKCHLVVHLAQHSRFHWLVSANRQRIRAERVPKISSRHA